MRTLFAAVAVIFGLLAVIALALPWITPQDYAFQRVNQTLARTSDFRLESARHIGLSLLPPGITIDGAVIAPPGDLKHLPSITAERVFAAIKLSALLEKKPHPVSRVVITRPEIVFGQEVSNHSYQDLTPQPGLLSGVRLAALGDERAQTDTPTLIQPFRRRPARLPRADIEVIDGLFSFSLGPKRDRIEAQHITITLRRPEPHGPAYLAGTLALEGEHMQLEGTAADPGDSDEPAPVTMRLRSNALQWTLDGSLAWQTRRFKGSARLEVLSGAALASWLEREDNRAIGSLDHAAFNGRLEISPAGLALDNATISGPGVDGSFDAAVEFGHVGTAHLKRLALHGGEGQGRFTLDFTHADRVALSGTLDLANVDTLALSTSISNFDWLSGRANASLKVEGTAEKLAQLADSVVGTGQLSVSNGALEGLDLPMLVAKVKNEGEFGKWHREAGQRTAFDSLSASFSVSNGIASTKDIMLTGPNIALSGEGQTNLLHQQLNYRLRAKVTARDDKPADGEDAAALDVPLVVKGDWKKPDIRPNISEALSDGKALSGNAKLFGKSVEKFTGGKVKADEFGRTIDALFGKKKKKDVEHAQ